MVLPVYPLMILFAQLGSFSSYHFCDTEIPMLMLLQHRNIGKIITLFIISAVAGVIPMHTLASNLILEDD